MPTTIDDEDFFDPINIYPTLLAHRRTILKYLGVSLLIWLGYHIVPWEFIWENSKSYVLGPIASCITFIFVILLDYVKANAKPLLFTFAVIRVSYRVTSWAVAWRLAEDEDEEEEETKGEEEEEEEESQDWDTEHMVGWEGASRLPIPQTPQGTRA